MQITGLNHARRGWSTIWVLSATQALSQSGQTMVMTVTAIIAGLMPILWSHGTGADVMKRIAAPMVGGMVSATVLTLVVIPAIYLIWRRWQVGREARAAVGASTTDRAAPAAVI